MISLLRSRLGSPAIAPPQLGLDIGVRRAKAACIGGDRNHPRLLWSVDEPTPPGVVGPVGVDPVAGGRLLVRLIGNRPVGAVEVSSVLSPAAVKLKRRVVGVAEPSRVIRALALDPALRIQEVEPSTLHFAFHPVITPQEEPGGSRTVLAAAARVDAIRGAQRLAREASLACGRIGVSAVALANLHAAAHPEEADEERLVLLHGGYGATEVVVLERGMPLLTHQLCGLDALLERLRQGGIEREDDSEALLCALESHDPVSQPRVIGEWLARVEQEIRRAVGAAERDSISSPAVRVFPGIRVTGGLARFTGLLRRLEEALRVPVRPTEVGLIFREGDHRGDAFLPALALAIGVALEARAGRRG